MNSGQMLAHYRILERLGAGGMGVVYKALDTRLNRTVAIKVLPPESVADPVHRQRFMQEARAASAIEHPNIVTIYEITEVDGQYFIAMQYVAGQTLRALLGRGGLPLTDTLRYRVQMADALALAHEQDIVHRDLKPENVMVAQTEGRAGQVKLLDFGLAKLTEPAASEDLAPTRTVEPPAQFRTEEGTILGTVAYMSPEQAEGKKVDARSDIFSFGSVLYEMITGRRAFSGETRMATLSAILGQEPKAPGAPPQLEWIVRHCLRKDPNRRFQHMADVKTALEELQEDSESGQLAVSAPRRRRVSPLIAGGFVLALAAIAGAGWWLATRRSPPPPSQGPVLTRLTSDSGLTTQPAVSLKGDLLAYASDRSGDGNLDIWVQQIGGGQPLRLTRDEADDEEPAFSPDGTRIAFRSGRDGGAIYTVSTLGGDERLLAREGRGPRFSPDGTQILYWTGKDFGKVYVVPSTGGAPRQLRPDFYSARNPVWSPDGKHVLFHGSQERNEDIGAEGYDWWVSSLDDGRPVRTGAIALFRGQRLRAAARIFLPDLWLPETSELVFSARLGDTINFWKVAMPLGSWRASGPAQRRTFGTGSEVLPAIAGPGRLVFTSHTSNIDVGGLRLDASQAKIQGDLHRWTSDPGMDSYPSLSADGTKMVFASTRAGKSDIWWKDLESGRDTALTATPSPEIYPLFSRHGSKLAYRVIEGSKASTYIMTLGSGPGGSIQPGPPDKVCENCAIPAGWFPDGQRLLYHQLGPPVQVRVFDLKPRQNFEFLRHPEHNVWAARVSPDNRWVAFEVQPVLAPGGLHLAPLYHFHRARLSMAALSGSQVSLSVARDKVAFTLAELSGNIWMAKLEK